MLIFIFAKVVFCVEKLEILKLESWDMAYNEHLADRISRFFIAQKVNFFEKKLFGGLCFMVNNKMCVGIIKDKLMARIGEDKYSEAINKIGCKEMTFTGRPMKGYVYINAEAVDLDVDLEY